jgi:hypothetical protein
MKPKLKKEIKIKTVQLTKFPKDKKDNVNIQSRYGRIYTDENGDKISVVAFSDKPGQVIELSNLVIKYIHEKTEKRQKMWDGRKPLIDFIKAVCDKASDNHGKQFREDLAIVSVEDKPIISFGYGYHDVNLVEYKEYGKSPERMSIVEAVDRFIAVYELDK